MDLAVDHRKEARAHPRLVIATVVGGAILLEWSSWYLQQLIVALILFFSHHVTPYYDSKSLARHFFLLNASVLSARLIESFVIGCLVAWAIKGRELIAAVSLSFVSLFFGTVVFWLMVAIHQPVNPRFFLSILVQQLGASCAVALGGVLVQQTRTTKADRFPVA